MHTQEVGDEVVRNGKTNVIRGEKILHFSSRRKQPSNAEPLTGAFPINMRNKAQKTAFKNGYFFLCVFLARRTVRTNNYTEI